MNHNDILFASKQIKKLPMYLFKENFDIFDCCKLISRRFKYFISYRFKKVLIKTKTTDVTMVQIGFK